MVLDPEIVVAEAFDGLDISEIPEELRSAIRKHQDHLLSLASALIHGGQSETVVRQTIDTVFQSYRDELASTIMAIREREMGNVA